MTTVPQQQARHLGQPQGPAEQAQMQGLREAEGNRGEERVVHLVRRGLGPLRDLAEPLEQEPSAAAEGMPEQGTLVQAEWAQPQE